jgi:hypothetical protein
MIWRPVYLDNNTNLIALGSMPRAWAGVDDMAVCSRSGCSRWLILNVALPCATYGRRARPYHRVPNASSARAGTRVRGVYCSA